MRPKLKAPHLLSNLPPPSLYLLPSSSPPRSTFADIDMVQDEASSSPLQSFSLMPLSPPSAPPPWLRELKSDERGLYLIHLLINCATHVASGSLDHANAFLDTISLLASPDGDTMQRIASYFTEALARRLLRSWPGLYRALLSSTPARLLSLPAAASQARRHFQDLAPFLRLARLVSNQAILEAMDGERMVHVIDLDANDPSQWLALLQSLSARPEGPPHLRITGVNEHRELLAHMAAVLSEEAERLDIPFQFNPVAGRLETLDIECLRVKTGEALAINSLLHLHSLLVPEDCHDKLTADNLHPVPVRQGTLGELLSNVDSASSSPLLPPCPRMESFLSALWGLSPKIVAVTEQDSNHNGATLGDRFMEALNFYAALFDCLESTVARSSVERVRVERMLFGEEIKNIIACEGTERKERHEKLDRWVRRLESAGFDRVPLSYYGLLQARRMLQSFGCDAYKVKEDNGCILICWQDRPLFSVSAWRCRRFD